MMWIVANAVLVFSSAYGGAKITAKGPISKMVVLIGCVSGFLVEYLTFLAMGWGF